MDKTNNQEEMSTKAQDKKEKAEALDEFGSIMN